MSHAGSMGSMGPLMLGLLLGVAVGCRPASEGTAKAENSAAKAATEPVRVQLVTAAERARPEFLRVTGQLQGIQDAQVAADTGGKVVDAPVERGSVVERGGVLARVDDRTATLSLKEAEAALALAEARLALARSESERNAPLVKTKAIAEADYRRLQAEQSVREADLASAGARRDLAAKALSDCVIRAPFAGLVVERLVQVGEYVRMETVVARVVDVSRLRLLLNVPETAAGQVLEGQSVEFTTTSHPGVVFAGKVRFVGGAVRESARDLIVEAEVDNKDGRLKPGFFAEARVRVGERRGVMVPAGALRVEGTRRSVFVLEGDLLAERLVEIGETLEGWVEVRRGLRAGEAVVSDPKREVADGQPAKVAQP